MNHPELMPAVPTFSRPDHSSSADQVLQETNQIVAIVDTLRTDLETMRTDGAEQQSLLVTEADREAIEQELRQIATNTEMALEQAGDQSVLHKAFVLHHDFYRDLRQKLENHAIEVKDRQNKIKFVHGIMQEINNLLDEKGGLDLTNHPALQAKLQAAQEMGINILANQVQFTSFQATRLIENLNSNLEDWNTENRTQLISIEHIFKESEQSVLLVKYLLTIYRDAIKAMCAGVKQ